MEYFKDNREKSWFRTYSYQIVRNNCRPVVWLNVIINVSKRTWWTLMNTLYSLIKINRCIELFLEINNRKVNVLNDWFYSIQLLCVRHNNLRIERARLDRKCNQRPEVLLPSAFIRCFQTTVNWFHYFDEKHLRNIIVGVILYSVALRSTRMTCKYPLQADQVLYIFASHKDLKPPIRLLRLDRYPQTQIPGLYSWPFPELPFHSFTLPEVTSTRFPFTGKFRYNFRIFASVVNT